MKAEIINEYFPRVKGRAKKINANKKQAEVRRKIESLTERKRLKESLKFF